MRSVSHPPSYPQSQLQFQPHHPLTQRSENHWRRNAHLLSRKPRQSQHRAPSCHADNLRRRPRPPPLRHTLLLQRLTARSIEPIRPKWPPLPLQQPAPDAAASALGRASRVGPRHRRRRGPHAQQQRQAERELRLRRDVLEGVVDPVPGRAGGHRVRPGALLDAAVRDGRAAAFDPARHRGRHPVAAATRRLLAAVQLQSEYDDGYEPYDGV